MSFAKYFRRSAKSPLAPTPSPTDIPLSQASLQDASSTQSRHTSTSIAMGGHDVVKHEVMLHYLYQQQANSGWRADREGQSQGVVLRIGRSHYVTCPPQLNETPLLDALKTLNIQVSSGAISLPFCLCSNSFLA